MQHIWEKGKKRKVPAVPTFSALSRLVREISYDRSWRALAALTLDTSERIEYILFMASTTFHFPDDFLREIDRAAQALHMSRNKFVLQACGEALARQAGEWPAGFFDPPHSKEDRTLLVESTQELEQFVLTRRMNRGAVAL